MLAPPPKTHIFKDFLEKPKENNEFEMFSIHYQLRNELQARSISNLIKNHLKNELWNFKPDLYQI